MTMRSAWIVCVLALCVPALEARKFYPDDPLLREPAPVPATQVKPRKISDIYDFFWHIVASPGEKQPPSNRIEAQDINTLGEVLEGSWYNKRHARQPMSPEQLVAGPGSENPPAEGPWTILSIKAEGVTPGFRIRDEKGRQYFLKFDPLGHRDMATAADVISSKFFHALGYHVPENYIVNFDRDRLRLAEGIAFRDSHGRLRKVTPRDVGEILTRVPRDPDGRLRATASRLLTGKPIGEYRYFGTRKDDPNDIVPHEHRRSLRGLQVFCAWLGHDDSRAINTLDTLVDEGGVPHVRHHLIDFGSTLGSASTKMNSPRSGFVRLFAWEAAAAEFLSLGLYVPKWATIDYPDLPSVGRFSDLYFSPKSWTPEYPNPAFNNRLPEDEFWAAEQVMAFTDDDIRAIVKTGQYTNPSAEFYVTDVLIRRRDMIGRTYLSKPLSLSRIRIDKGRLAFDDLAVVYGYVSAAPQYQYSWFALDNEKETRTWIKDGRGLEVPSSPSPYIGVEIAAPGDERRRVTVYLRKAPGSYEVVGIERAL